MKPYTHGSDSDSCYIAEANGQVFYRCPSPSDAEHICYMLNAAYEQGIAALRSQLARVMAERDELRMELRITCIAKDVMIHDLAAKLVREICDRTYEDTAIRNAARPHLPALAVDGDHNGVPSTADVVEALAARCAELERK